MSTNRQTAPEHFELHELVDRRQFGALADGGPNELGRDVERFQLDERRSGNVAVADAVEAAMNSGVTFSAFNCTSSPAGKLP
jgi:hypothetical protein